jgi:hypothetical protein
MAIGDFLASAGRVGAGMREAQAEMRAARLEQLRIEEANRNQQMVNQLSGEMRAAGLNYTPLTPGEKMDLEVVEAPPPAKKKPATKPAAAPAAAPAPAPAPAAALSGAGGATTVSGSGGADRLEPTVSRPGVKQGIDYLTPQEEAELAKLQKLFSPTPGYTAFESYGAMPTGTLEERRLQKLMQPRYDELRAKQATASAKARTAGETFVTQLGLENEARARGIQLPTPAAPAAAPAAEPTAAKPAAGVTPPEAKAAAPAEQAAPVAMPTTPQEVVQYETEQAKQPIAPEVRTKADFYLAEDPTRLSLDMQQALTQREELVRYANIMLSSRTAQGVNAALQVRAQITAIDRSLLELQGMQGIQELTMFRDPRRLAGVLSMSTQGRIAIQPRSDGTYNIIAAPGTPQQQAIETGLTTDELGTYAMRQFSAEYRARDEQAKSALLQKAQEGQIEVNIEAAKAKIKLWADMTMADKNRMKDLAVAYMGYRGKVDAAKWKAAMENAGMKSLFKDADGNVFGLGNDGAMYEFMRAQQGETKDGEPIVIPSYLSPVPVGQ